jgi:hypothetical protein
MRSSAFLIFAVLFASVAPANNRQWKDAKVVKITSENGGALVAPIGTMTVGVPITKVFYWIQTDDTTYILGPAFTKRQSLNVTLYGKTKIALDGRNAHILDDEGKDVKLPISEKIARTETPSVQSNRETDPSTWYQVIISDPSSNPLGVVFVVSNPNGAEIYVDDAFISKAPATLNLKPGQHYVRAFMNDYKNWSRQVTITAGTEAHLTVTLEKSN